MDLFPKATTNPSSGQGLTGRGRSPNVPWDPHDTFPGPRKPNPTALDMTRNLCDDGLGKQKGPTMTPTTITAAELEAGDYIIGDRIYANGTLHFDVSNVTREGDLIKVDCTSRPYDTPRLIAYGAEEKVTVTR